MKCLLKWLHLKYGFALLLCVRQHERGYHMNARGGEASPMNEEERGGVGEGR